jgi:acyl-CoA reductase-like NAD-dependent aldehyde dehydrogenase
MATTEQHITSNGGPATATKEEFEVRNPATGELVDSVPKLGNEDVAEAAARARAAQPAWEALGIDGRAEILKRFGGWMAENKERIIETVVAESGKSYEDAQTSDWAYGLAAAKFWSKNTKKHLKDERIRSSNPLIMGKKLKVRYAPYGLVGVIGPWNYPIVNSFGDAIPALMAGNAVLLKPASATPTTSILLKEGLVEAGMPADVLQITTGPGAIGDAIVDAVDMIMFTGSTAVGQSVMRRAAETLTPVSLELGGKDPMIVLSDANVDRAANLAVFWSMFNGGQTCISVERVYVEEPIYDEFVDKVEKYAKELRVGKPDGPGSVDVGAVTTPDQLDLIESHVEDAKAKGARVLVGGKRGSGPGQYFEPTVLVDVDHTMECMTEETFGPTLPIMKVKDEQEAISLANDSPYGLGASVVTKNMKHGDEVARQVEAGAVCVNDALMNYFAMELPMGGWKTSGVGSRHGADGIRKYTRKQSILQTRIAPKKDPTMYPYKASRTRQLGKLLKVLFKPRGA